MSLVASKPADEIRETWQSRALRTATGKLQRVLLVALAKEYPQALTTLLLVTFGTTEFSRPFFSGYATIAPSGRIVCEVIGDDYETNGKRTVEVYRTENLFIYEMRKLADELKLVDKDRTEMFTVLQKWVASDRRINLHGEKKAS